MKPRVTPCGLWLIVLMAALAGCSSAQRPHKPAVAILVSIPGLDRAPSPEEMASIRSVLQPELERRGYVVAEKTHQADYFVQVTNLSNPIGRQLTLQRVPYRDSAARNPDLGDGRSLSQRAGTGMPTEPSRETRGDPSHR